MLRGLETLAVRLDRSEASARVLAEWLEAQPFVREVRHPAWPSTPGHAHWIRDFAGASGLFSVFLDERARPQLPTCVEALSLFAIGASWGGTHSVVAPLDRPPPRTATPAPHDGPILRFSVGMEHPDDLLADLRQAFDPLAAQGETTR